MSLALYPSRVRSNDLLGASWHRLQGPHVRLRPSHIARIGRVWRDNYNGHTVNAGLSGSTQRRKARGLNHQLLSRTIYTAKVKATIAIGYSVDAKYRNLRTRYRSAVGRYNTPGNSRDAIAWAKCATARSRCGNAGYKERSEHVQGCT